MKRFAVVLGALVVGVLIGSARRSFGPGQDLCSGFTVARMLEDPELARQYFGALHGGDASAREQLDAMVGSLRAAHGCGATGENASQDTFAQSAASRRASRRGTRRSTGCRARPSSRRSRAAR